MHKVINGSSHKRLTLVCAAVLVLAVMPLSATTHVIQFGGSVGLAYSPKTMNVAVGDTVKWIGDFTVHPLSSSTIPGGATAWQSTVGTQFSYIIPVVGTYNYNCTVHGAPDGSGMAGSFTAAVTGVAVNQSSTPAVFQLEQNYPNPFNPTTTIRFSIPERSRVRATILNLLGQQVAELANEEMSAGNFERIWNANVASGLYFYRLEAVSVNDPGKRFVDVKKMVLVR